MPESEAQNIAIELCRQYPDTSTRLLARMLYDRCNGMKSYDACRSVVRTLRGARGDKMRKYAKFQYIPRPPVPVPDTLAEEWTPYRIETQRLGILSDIHSPYHDPKAVAAAVEQLQRKEIDHLLLNGDILDFYSISFFEKRPTKRDFRKERDQGLLMLDYLRKSFPDTPITYKLGNHEERWYRWLWARAPEIGELPDLSFAQWFKLADYGMECVQDQRIVLAGELPIAHGHELGRSSIAPAVNPARGAFLRTMHTILVGHHHRTSSHCETNMWRDEVFVWSVGCLCAHNPEYARIGKTNQGFAFVSFETAGNWSVENYRLSKDYTVRQ